MPQLSKRNKNNAEPLGKRREYTGPIWSGENQRSSSSSEGDENQDDWDGATLTGGSSAVSESVDPNKRVSLGKGPTTSISDEPNPDGSSKPLRSQKLARGLSAGLFSVAFILLIVVWAVPLFTLYVPSGSGSDASTVSNYTVYLYRQVYEDGSTKSTSGNPIGFPNLGGTNGSVASTAESIPGVPDPIVQTIVEPGLMRGLAAAVVGLLSVASIMALLTCITPVGRAVYLCYRKRRDRNRSGSPEYTHATSFGRWCSDMHRRWKARKQQWRMETLPSVFEVTAAVTTALTTMAAITMCMYCLIVSKGVFALPAGSISQAWVTISALPIFASIIAALCMWLALCCLLFVTPSWANRDPVEVWDGSDKDQEKHFRSRHCRHISKAVLFVLTAVTVLSMWIGSGILKQVGDDGTKLYFNAMGKTPWTSSGSKDASSTDLTTLNDQQNVRAWVATARILYGIAFVSLVAILPLIVVEATSHLKCWEPHQQSGRRRCSSCHCCCAGKKYTRNRCFKHVSIALAFFCVAAFVLIAASASISLNAWANVAYALNSASSGGSSSIQLSFLPSSIAIGCLAILTLLTGGVFLTASYLIGPRKIEDWLLQPRHALSLGAIVLGLLGFTLHILPLIPDFKLFQLAGVQLPSASSSTSVSGFDFYMLQLCPVTALGGPVGPCSINVAMPFLNANVSGSTELAAAVAGSSISAKWAYSRGVPLYQYWFPVVFSCWLLAFLFALRYERHGYKRAEVVKNETAVGTYHVQKYWRKFRNEASWRVARPCLLIVFTVLLVISAWLNAVNVFLIQKAIVGDFGPVATGTGTTSGKRSVDSEGAAMAGKVVKKYYIVAAVVVASAFFTASAVESFVVAYRLLRPSMPVDIEVAKKSDDSSPTAVIGYDNDAASIRTIPNEPLPQYSPTDGPPSYTLEIPKEKKVPADHLFTLQATLADLPKNSSNGEIEDPLQPYRGKGKIVFVYDGLDRTKNEVPFADQTAYWLKGPGSESPSGPFYYKSKRDGTVEMALLVQDSIAWRQVRVEGKPSGRHGLPEADRLEPYQVKNDLKINGEVGFHEGELVWVGPSVGDVVPVYNLDNKVTTLPHTVLGKSLVLLHGQGPAESRR